MTIAISGPFLFVTPPYGIFQVDFLTIVMVDSGSFQKSIYINYFFFENSHGNSQKYRVS